MASPRGFENDARGWAGYGERLRQLALDPEEQERRGFAAMSQGWAIGTAGWRRALAKDHAAMVLVPGLAAQEARALREARWQTCLEGALAGAKRAPHELEGEPCSAAWKLDLALKVRAESGASAAWLGERLHLGKPESVRSLLSGRRRVLRKI